MTSRFCNLRVKIRQFCVGDLVSRVFKARKPKKQDKLNLKWEGPYKIRRVIGMGTYEWEELSGRVIKHTWHEIYLVLLPIRFGPDLSTTGIDSVWVPGKIGPDR
ncbi:hypothetical protein LIER_02089 [Lithospermum erythrorhizon]|uniref:Uncharacterized protein n=1 Tax=Lithospermum erythrorhizon TaxID=34254 RepID=A0AAV3NSW7_LITER